MKIRSFTVGAVSTECYLVCDEKNKISFAVDPGDESDKILRAIEEEGCQLKYVILTHAHFDHVMAVGEICEQTGAELVVCDREEKSLNDPHLAGYHSFGLTMKGELSADVVVKDGDEIDFGEEKLVFLNTPGHTKGSMCIVMGEVIFTGDTLFAGTCGRCDLPGGDYAEMLDSLKRLGELEGDFILYPGHGEPTSLDIERRYNPYMREAIRR